MIVEIAGPQRAKTSEAFSDCSSGGAKGRLAGDALIVEIPTYIPHPDLLDAKELRQREKAVEVYTWRAGKLSGFSKPVHEKAQ